LRRLAALTLTAVALLGGCASFRRPDPIFTWRRDDADDVARLILVASYAPEPRATMACQRGSGAVDLTLVGRRADGAVIELHAGETWNRYRGAGVATDGPDAPIEIQTRLNAADPVLARFADTGDLTVVQGDVVISPANAFAQAHDFLALCRAG